MSATRRGGFMPWVWLAVAILGVWASGSQLVVASDSADEVPFRLYRGYAIVVRGSIGNLSNLNFLIDTGAVPSVLDRRIARKLRLAGTLGKLSVFTQKLDTEHSNAPNVQLGQLHADALPVVVRDLSFAEQALGTRVDAMIGFDFLGQSAFTIDYVSKKIVFGPIDASLAAIPYQSRPGLRWSKCKFSSSSFFFWWTRVPAISSSLRAGFAIACQQSGLSAAEPGPTWVGRFG